MSRWLVTALAVSLCLSSVATGQAVAKLSPARLRMHPLPVVGATRERFEAIDAVTIGDRIFAAERGPYGGWLRVYDASDVANPLELRDAMAPIVGRPLGIAGDSDRVLVASVTEDTTRIRLTLFDVARGDRTRWSGAASLPVDVFTGGVEQMYMRGTFAVLKLERSQMLLIDVAEIEREFAGATHGDESSAGGRAALRALKTPGAVLGTEALTTQASDSMRGPDGIQQTGYEFPLNGQLDARQRGKGALISIGQQWVLDIFDAATRRLAFTTRTDPKNVNPLVAPDSGDVLVNDLVRVGEIAGRKIAVFNTNIMGPGDRKRAWTGVALVDVTNPAAPRVAGVDRQASEDTIYLRYGWHPYVRDVVFARDAAVIVSFDATWVARFDSAARMTSIDSTGRFGGRLVPGPDGTVLELSIGARWRDSRRIVTADTSVPAIRIRTTTPRIAVREGPAAITVDERGASSVEHRIRFEIVSPSAVPEPAQLLVAGPGLAVTLPVTRRGALLEARLPAGAAVGRGTVTFALSSGAAAARWIALGIPPTAVAGGAARSFVSMVDPFTEAGVVIPDSGSGATTDAAFTDRRLRARLARDSSATIFVVAGSEGPGVRVVRRDRGRAQVFSARSVALASYPGAARVATLATLRHLGTSTRLRISFCLRDALGKRVQQELDLTLVEQVTNPPCGDEGAIREWLRVRGAVIVEGPHAAVVINRRHLPPTDTLVESWRRKRWVSARADLQTDSTTGNVWYRFMAREDSTSSSSPDSGVTRPLTAAERSAVAATLGDAALLSIFAYAATDSTDSTAAVIRLTLSPRLVPGNPAPRAMIVTSDEGDFVYGDWDGSRFVPRWEAWSYSTQSAAELVDLDGDGITDFIFSSESHDMKGHVVSQEMWAFDRAGRQLTRQQGPRAPDHWGSEQAADPISVEVTDSEYCEGDCGGLAVGRPGPDGARPLISQDGSWILHDWRYVFHPNPPKPKPKPKPAAKRKPPVKRAPRKTSR